MTTLSLRRETHWVCPNCDETAVTNDPRPHSRMHQCRGLRGLLEVPMVEEGIRCKVEAAEWGDYVGNEIVTVDGTGRPIMNVTTTRDNGTDTAVYAPCARSGVDT